MEASDKASWRDQLQQDRLLTVQLTQSTRVSISLQSRMAISCPPGIDKQGGCPFSDIHASHEVICSVSIVIATQT